jgi:hypothetical protein
VHTASSASEWADAVFTQRVGRELWRSLLLALFIALLIELLLANAGGVSRRVVSPSHRESGAEQEA